MRSPSKREAACGRTAAGGVRAAAFALAAAVLFTPAALLARPLPSLAAMARLEAADNADRFQVISLFRGYVSLGLRREASLLLERLVRTGVLPPAEAAPLFEELIEGQSRGQDPRLMIAIAETALRSGVRTPMVLYAYGTALRMSGRTSEGMAVLAKVENETDLYPQALYGIGQGAAERGDLATAADVFGRVGEICRGRPGEEFLASRALLSQAEALLLLGRGPEAARLFEAVLRVEDDPLAKAGLLAARPDGGAFSAVQTEEAIAALPPRQRILFFLLQGALARERRRYDAAAAFLSRAEREIDAALALPEPPVSAERDEPGAADALAMSVAGHQALRETIASLDGSSDPDKTRDSATELLTGLLLLNQQVAGAPGTGPFPGIPAGTMSPEQIEDVLDALEEVSLDGLTADQLVEAFSRKLDTLQNLAHPIRRYRLLGRLERSQEEIHAARKRIREQRRAMVSERGGAPGDETIRALLEGMGQLLREIEAMRLTMAETSELTRTHFDIFPKDGAEGASAAGPAQGIQRALALDRDHSSRLEAAASSLREKDRTDAWNRERNGILALRAAAAAQTADLLVAQAREITDGPIKGWTPEALDAAERAASLLREDLIPPEDRVRIAVDVGMLIVRGRERWETAATKVPGRRESALIADILPALDAEAGSGKEREAALYLAALLRMTARDGNASGRARDFLKEYSASLFAGDLAVRLGNEALAGGRAAEAVPLFRFAAEGPNAEAATVARYLLGWIRFHKGDTEGAAAELSFLLSDPSCFCGELSLFEKDVVSLAERVWRDLPLDRLAAYGPVGTGQCGGRRLLIALGEAEEKRGETDRAVRVYEILAQRFPEDEAAPAYEVKTVENLLRQGKEREAVSRALTLKEKYGPDSAWWASAPPAAREADRTLLEETLKKLSENRFSEGLRSGSRSAMSESAAIMEQLADLSGEPASDADAELRLKWAIASIRSGDRETGLALLEDLLGEQRGDAVEERAALVYAEALVAGFERNEAPAADALGAAFFLLDDFPSEKSASLALRCAEALARAGEYPRARLLADAITRDGSVPPALLARAQLVIAEAALTANDWETARAVAASVMEGRARDVDAGMRERARDIYLLSSLKEADTMTGRRDHAAAAKILEELADRFPQAPEAPDFAFRAARSYGQGRDTENAVKLGLQFVERYPKRPEAAGVAVETGKLLEMQGERTRAADLYDNAASSLPPGKEAAALLFRAACLARDSGRDDDASKRFARYRARYSVPRWRTAYASLSLGFMAHGKKNLKTALREIEAGLKQVDAGVEADAPPELREMAARGRIIVGTFWTEEFRKLKLAPPLEKNLAVKERFFRRALDAFGKAEGEASLEESLAASQLSGDLFLDFGKAILASTRPKGLKKREREAYERALGERARSFLHRAQDYYTRALDRLESERGTSDQATAIGRRLAEAQKLLAGMPPEKAGQ